jgi:hypothetical protein
MSSLDFAVVPDINQPETLDIQNESPSPRSNLHYRNMQEYLRNFPHRHDEYILENLLDTELSMQQDYASPELIYLMGRITMESYRISEDLFDLAYLNSHFRGLQREILHFLSHSGHTWFSLMNYIGYLVCHYDNNYLSHDLNVCQESNQEMLERIQPFFREEQQDENQEEELEENLE